MCLSLILLLGHKVADEVLRPESDDIKVQIFEPDYAPNRLFHCRWRWDFIRN